MNQPILLGVAMEFDLPTAIMLQMAGDFLLLFAPHSRVILLTVIPVPYNTPSSLGRFRGQAPSLAATTVQRTEAYRTLQRAQAILMQSGLSAECLDVVVREGAPAQELVRLASERQVGCIVLGQRGFAFRQRLRRFLLGSTTAQILRRAPCPVLFMPCPPGPLALVAWYEEALTRWLNERPSGFFIFTPERVASRFPPTPHTHVRRKEVLAAKEALQRLADKGVLICQQVKGTWQCFND